MARHRRLWGDPAISRDLGKPDALPRHSTATHAHDFKPVAVFEGLRSGVAQCSCGETKTTFMGDSLDRVFEALL